MNCTKVTLKELTTPREGQRVMLDRWWVVDKDSVLFYRKMFPQCNPSEEIARHIRDRIYPDCAIVFVPVAFVEDLT